MTPYHHDDLVTLWHIDALDLLRQMDTGTVDAILTDPPYSSGGKYRGDRTQTTAIKYTDAKRNSTVHGFTGDNRDQRGFAFWSALWLAEALRITKPGGALAVWSDWRQLPTVTDVIQAGGWVWRGLACWAKPDARPQSGRPTQQTEYVVWATAGPRKLAGDTIPGWWVATWNRAKLHHTEKPLVVLRDLVKLAPPGGLVLDPFMGGGTTGLAALAEGRQFAGADLDAHWCEVTRDRLAAARLQATTAGSRDPALALDLPTDDQEGPAQ